MTETSFATHLPLRGMFEKRGNAGLIGNISVRLADGGWPLPRSTPRSGSSTRP